MGIGYGFSDDQGRVGPGFLPVVAGAFIAVASGAELLRLVLRPSAPQAEGIGSVADEIKAKAETNIAAESHELRSESGRTNKTLSVAIIFVGMAVSILLIPVIGLLLSLGLLILAIMVIVEKRPIWLSAIVAAAAVLVAYLIFVRMLYVPVPQGALGLI